MVSWFVLNFILVIYRSASHLTNSLIGPPVVAWRVLWIQVCPFFRYEVFLELAQSFFLELSRVFRTYVVLYMRELGFLEIFLPQKMGKMGQNGPNTGFFEFIGKFSYCFWLWSIMKVYIICCILAKISYLAKIWFLRYRPKCSWPIRLQDFIR